MVVSMACILGVQNFSFYLIALFVNGFQDGHINFIFPFRIRVGLLQDLQTRSCIKKLDFVESNELEGKYNAL